jgi:hypothetical protein
MQMVRPVPPVVLPQVVPWARPMQPVVRSPVYPAYRPAQPVMRPPVAVQRPAGAPQRGGFQQRPG